MPTQTNVGMKRYAPNWARRTIAVSIVVLSCTDTLADDERWQADPTTNCLIWNSHPRPDDVFSWSGSCVDGFAEGRGISKWSHTGKDGRRIEYVFDVTMRHGRIVGSGTVYYPDGSIYEGELDDGLPHGRGSYTFGRDSANAGDRFVGSFDYGGIGAEGSYHWRDGTSYIGSFLDGLPNGRGRQTFADGQTFEGPFEQGQAHGTGVCSNEQDSNRPCRYERGRFVGWIF